MSTLKFDSYLAAPIRRLIELRQITGTDYQAQSLLLAYFDRFLVKQKLVDQRLTRQIIEAYEEKGFFIDKAELPDYIPLFLEFLSLCPLDEAIALLGEPIDIMATIAARLQERDSSWAALFAAAVALSKAKPNKDRIEEALAQGLEDNSLEALDKEWEESAAFSGQPDQSDCRACVTPQDGLNVTITQ